MYVLLNAVFEGLCHWSLLDLELEMVASYPVRVLGNELKSSAKRVHALNH